MISSYWSNKLGKKNILAFQDSSRTGILKCDMLNYHVKIQEKAVLYSICELKIQV